MNITKNGYTMTELVVTVALIGTLLSFAVPRYASVSEETQGERNIANMQIIRESFFHYFYRMHQKEGRVAHFPPQPVNADTVMDETWSNTPMAPAGISLVCLGWPGTVVWCHAITHLVFAMIRTLGSIEIRPVFALLLSKKIVCVASWGLALRQRRWTSTSSISWRSIVSLQSPITIAFHKISSKISNEKVHFF